MISPFRTISFIVGHPLGRRNKLRFVKRYLGFQLGQLVNPSPVIFPMTDRCCLVVEKGMDGATGNIYVGLHEFEDMSFLLHYLREQDLFVDIGANIGSYTILASGHVGCHTIAFEPIPSTYRRLERNIAVNRINDYVKSYNLGVGATKEIVRFTSVSDAMNHVALEKDLDATIDVQIEKLDSLISGQHPAVMKIDVEGYESKVIEGASELLQDPSLNVMIVELNGSGHRYNLSDNDTHRSIMDIGFKPYAYHPFDRTLEELTTHGNMNTIYIRDIKLAEARVREAASFSIAGQVI